MKTALLFTDNATIKKLFSLSLEKKEITLINGDVENPEANGADVIFVDNTIYSDELMQKLPENIDKVLILGKNEENRAGFIEYMHKPFLPTDLIELISKLEEKLNNPKNEEENKEEENELNLDDNLNFDDELSFDNNDDLDFEDDLSFDDDLTSDSDESTESNDDLSIDEEELNFDNDENKNLSPSDDLLIDEEELSFDDKVEEETAENGNIEANKEEENDMLNKNVEQELETIEEKNIAEALGEEVPELEEENKEESLTENVEDKDNNLNEEKNGVEETENETSSIEETETEEKTEETKEEETTQNVVENEESNKAVEPTTPITPEVVKNSSVETNIDTIQNLLNINLEALKNSGATLTITIKFNKE